MAWLTALMILTVLTAAVSAEGQAGPNAQTSSPGISGASGAGSAAPVTGGAAKEEFSAVIVSVSGPAQYRADGEDPNSPWMPLKEGDVLGEKALIRTGLGALVVLRMGDRSEVTIQSAAKIGLRDCRKEGDVARMGVGLKYGTVKAKIHRAAGPNDFRVHTPVATLSVRGSAGVVSYSAGFGMQFHSQQSTWNVQTPMGTAGIPQGAATDHNLTAQHELAARQYDSRVGDPFGLGGGEGRTLRDNSNPTCPFNPIGGTMGGGLSTYLGLGTSINRSDCPIPIPPSPGDQK